MDSELRKRETLLRRMWVGSLVLGCAVVLQNAALGEVTEKHRTVVQTIFDRVVEVAEEPQDWDVWPPELIIEDNPQVNALAGPAPSKRKRVPQITVYRGLIDLFEAKADVLAPTICHEFQHLLRIHSEKHSRRLAKFGQLGAATAVLAVRREEELEADFCGMELALKAGFSRLGVRENYQAMLNADKGDRYSPFEALRFDHPTWEERAAYMERGTTHEPLWRAMASFRNGVHLLEAENYVHAAYCFRATVEEFPGFCEGWNNLAHAYLMQAFDRMNETQLEELGAGHLAEGAFFSEPESLVAMCTCDDQRVADARGVPKVQPVPLQDYLTPAQAALEKADEFKDRLVSQDGAALLEANLALASLLAGQAQRANHWVSKSLERLRETEPEAVDLLKRASVFVNAAALELTVGKGQEDAEFYREATVAIRRANNSRIDGKREFSRPRVERLENALSLNRGLRLMVSKSREDHARALDLIRSYLDHTEASSAWWDSAYTKYAELTMATGGNLESKQSFGQPDIADWRKVSAVVLPDGHLLGLSQRSLPALEPLGKADDVVPVVADEILRRHNFEELGISVLGCRETISVFLTSERAPAVQLARPGLSGRRAELKVGMPRRELEDLIGDEWSVHYISIDAPEVIYHLYRSLNLAVLYNGSGKVSELVLVVVPVNP